jgi:hypothetical protein
MEQDLLRFTEIIIIIKDYIRQLFIMKVNIII